MGDDPSPSKLKFEYGPAKLFDESTSKNPSEAWRSACLNCNPEVVDETHNGPVEIIMTISGETTVNCVAFFQEEGHNSSSIVIERGPVSGPGCSMSPGSEFCKPTMVWTKYGMPPSPSTPEEKIVTTCGVPQTKYYGELLVFPGTEVSGHYAQVGAKSNPTSKAFYVPSVCHCQELCIANVGIGCRSYVYDVEKYLTGKGNCLMQTNLFDVQKSSPVGVFGPTGARIVKDSPYLTGFSFDAPPVDGMPFALTLEGVGFPYSRTKAEDTSDFQRIKIVRADSICAVAIPDEVEGIGCAESTRVIPTIGGNTREQTVYTICSPRPSMVSSDSVSWSGLTVTAGEAAVEYSVCYCAGNCFAPSAWEKVPGTFAMEKSTFTWSTAAASVYRKDAATGGLGELTLNA